jgi:hypothetical protein
MILTRTVLENSYLKKDGNNLVFPDLFGITTKVLVLNPTVYTPSLGQITNTSQLESAKVTFNKDLVLNASDFLVTSWESNGWNNLEEDIQVFVESNFRYDADGKNRTINWITSEKNIDGLNYRIVFLYPGNQGDSPEVSFFSFASGDGGGFGSIDDPTKGTKIIYNR